MAERAGSATPPTGVEQAAASMVASVLREASQFPGDKRWIVLSLYAEIHRRAAAALDRAVAEQVRDA